MRRQVSFALAALALGLVAGVSAASAGNLSDPAAVTPTFDVDLFGKI